MRWAGLTALLVASIWLSATPLSAASTFADPAFQSLWQQGEAIAPNFWGPLGAAKEGQQEPYKEATTRLVQYFDKGRMELGAKNAVTSGLLATELIKGQIQVGEATFEAKPSPVIPIAGDPDNPGPTYAQLNAKGSALFDPAPQQTGSATQASVSANGDVTIGGAPSAPATFVVFDDATKHNVPQAFADYRTRIGILNIGYALCEPFYATVKVSGTPRQVIVQVFERRVLTYTSTNPDPFKVEMGNIGQHYYRWRYATTNTSPSSVTAPATTTPTTTATSGSATKPVAPLPPKPPPVIPATGGDGPVSGSGAACPAGFPVKANDIIGLYYLPGQKTYDTLRALHCFRTEQAAGAAGYRKASA